MSDHPCRRILVYALLVCLVLPGCAAKTTQKMAPSDEQPSPPVRSSAHTQGQRPPKAPAQGTAAQKPSAAVAAESAEATMSPKQHAKAGDYEKALDEYAADYRKHPRDQALTAEYMKSVEEMKSAADKAYEEEGFSSAGRVYDLLLKHYGQFKDFAQRLTFDKAHLNRKLSSCKKSLSVRGFQEYRKGNLNEAIVMWQGLLAIDPNNEDIQKTVNTATEQQRNLQRKK
jgi:hypothetical protein